MRGERSIVYRQALWVAFLTALVPGAVLIGSAAFGFSFGGSALVTALVALAAVAAASAPSAVALAASDVALVVFAASAAHAQYSVPFWRGVWLYIVPPLSTGGVTGLAALGEPSLAWIAWSASVLFALGLTEGQRRHNIFAEGVVRTKPSGTS